MENHVCSPWNSADTQPPTPPQGKWQGGKGGGGQLLGIIRKLHMEHGLNWVEALPRAIRMHHDSVGESGLTPFVVERSGDPDPVLT